MVVFFDIDGTLIDDATQIIPDSARRAVEQLGKNVHLAVINTGRPYAHIDPRIREMPFRGWVCGCGMEIMLDGTWLTRRLPEEALCRWVVELVRRTRMQVVYESREGAIWLDGELSRHSFIAREAEAMAKKGFSVGQIDDLPWPEFMKLVTFDGPDSRREEFIREISPYFGCIDRGSTMLEIVLGDCSKAGGMQALLTHLGVDRGDSLAIGDSTNDLPMFSVAGHCVCMGGGMQQLKEKAEYITASVLDDGIEKALRHYGLI